MNEQQNLEVDWELINEDIKIQQSHLTQLRIAKGQIKAKLLKHKYGIEKQSIIKTENGEFKVLFIDKWPSYKVPPQLKVIKMVNGFESGNKLTIKDGWCVL